jgi:[protein-PII] uridylyltransferase
VTEVTEFRSVERRAAAAIRLVGDDRCRVARITGAPPGYLVALDASDVARHAALLSPRPAPGRVPVVVTPGRLAGEWHVDVAAGDRPGLLAACTGVLSERGIDVVQAVLATWDDGAALEAFVVRCTSRPDTAALQAAFEASLDRPRSSPALPDAAVTFRPDASPLYTACEVRAPDRPGLLHALAVAISAAGADVHAARVSTVDGMACDRFDLSDGAGRKLPADMEAGIRANVRDGVASRVARRWLRPRRR